MDMDQAVGRLRTLAQAAEIKGMSPDLLLHYVSRGRGPRSYKLGRFYYFDIEELRKWDKSDHQIASGRRPKNVPR